MSAPDLQSLFFVECDMEVEFRRLLVVGGATPNIYVSRSRTDQATPWLEVLFLVGRVTRKKQHQALTGYNLYFDCAWEGSSLEFKVTTQRQNNSSDHTAILGRLRSLVSLPALCGYPTAQSAWTQEFHAITDIRENGTTQACDTENDLDISTVTFSVVHNIKESAWPANTLPFTFDSTQVTFDSTLETFDYASA